MKLFFVSSVWHQLSLCLVVNSKSCYSFLSLAHMLFVDLMGHCRCSSQTRQNIQAHWPREYPKATIEVLRSPVWHQILWSEFVLRIQGTR